MSKPHASNPRWKRLIRNKRLILERAERQQERRQPKLTAVVPVPAGRCGERDRFGHRCKRHDGHEIHRAFGREWMGSEKP